MVQIGALISLFWTLLGVIYYPPPSGAVDCNGLQGNKYILNSCCNGPKFTLDAYKQACGKYMPEGIPKVSACLHECMYNASNVLINNRVNLDNARQMIMKLLVPDSGFADVFFDAISNCSGSINEMKKLLKRRPPPLPGMEQCSALPMIISLCCQRYVSTHCPDSKWIPTATCERARQCEMLG